MTFLPLTLNSIFTKYNVSSHFTVNFRGVRRFCDYCHANKIFVEVTIQIEYNMHKFRLRISYTQLLIYTMLSFLRMLDYMAHVRLIFSTVLIIPINKDSGSCKILALNLMIFSLAFFSSLRSSYFIVSKIMKLYFFRYFINIFYDYLFLVFIFCYFSFSILFFIFYLLFFCNNVT